jgi:hypothetical protein
MKKGLGEKVMEKLGIHGKPTFQHIRQQAKTREGRAITRQDIATHSGLSIGEVYIIDIGGYSSKQSIYKLLRAFNELTGQRLNIHDFRHGSTEQ